MKKMATVLFLLLPFLLLMLVFLIGMVNGILQSFGVFLGTSAFTPTLHYYREVLHNPHLMASILLSLWIATVSSVLSVLLGTLLCVGMIFLEGLPQTARKKRRFSFWKGLLKIPILMPHLMVGLLAIMILGQSGLLARFAYALGLIAQPAQFPQLLYDRYGLGVILAYLWKEIPFVCYYVMVMMSHISHTYREAAINLGASSWQSFVYVTLPLCKKTILHVFLILFAFSFGAYELPYLLGATAPKAMPVQAFLAYTHPDLSARPYAMVFNAIMMFCGIAISVFYLRIMQRQHTLKKLDRSKQNDPIG